MEMFFPLIIVAFIFVFIAVAVMGHRQAKARRAMLAAWAAENGLHFDESRRRDVDDQFPGFDLFRRGSGRYGENFMTGARGSFCLTVFEYHYKTESGSGDNRRTHHHRYTVVILQPPFPLKPLSVRAEGFWDKITSAFGWDDIDFESAEFSRRFHVSAPDRRWAFDVLTPRNMEFLMEREKTALHMNERHLMMPLRGRAEPAAILEAIATGTTILAGIPAFARENP